MLPIFSSMIFKPFVARRRGWRLSMPLGMSNAVTFIATAFIATALFSSSYAAEGGRRVALVVGNSAYQKTSSLPNPIHDAEDTAAALQRLGFGVSELHNADYSAFRRALLDFNRAA